MIPRDDPLKPRRQRPVPGARTIRSPKLVEGLEVTAAEHTLESHTGQLASVARLAFETMVQSGAGVPTHDADLDTQYRDTDTDKVYINTDGGTTWAEIGTGAAATTFLGLTDTPASYAGETGKVAAVNGAETALEFIAAGGAPTTADYLVGTAQAGLSAEIVVGATPGGELGGTWASPTVDATHSGSEHHAALTIGADAQHSLATHVLSGVAASATQVGHVELATIAETDTGTDATRAVTPDGLAGSNYGERTIGILVSDPGGDAITVGDSKAYAVIPSTLNGWNLVEVAAQLSTVSSSGIPTVQLHRSRRASATTRTLADMLSTKLTIDASEFESSDAATAAVIDTANDDVNTGDQIHIDIDVAGTGAKGLFVVMTFRLP